MGWLDVYLDEYRKEAERKGHHAKKNFLGYYSFIEEAIRMPRGFWQDRYGNGYGEQNYWAGENATTWEDSCDLALKGWTKGRQEILKISDRINIRGRIKLPQIAYDVTGDCYDMGKLVAGEPESAMYWTPSATEIRNSGKCIKIIVNTATSAVIDESIMRLRGANVLAVIDALEAVGYTTEIWAIFSARDREDIRVRVKDQGEQIGDDIISFAVAHPSFSRRFAHAIVGTGIIPGDPKGIEKECDLYIPAMMYGAGPFESEEGAYAWLLEVLAKYDITVEED